MRIRVILFLAIVVAVTARLGAATDPASALAEAKGHLNAKSYAKAVAVLEPAIESAASIADPAEQKQALTALHFYAALAYSGMRREDDALSHLEEAFRLSPNMHAVNTSRYDAAFVKLFERARSAVVGAGRFEELYPGFAAMPVPKLADLASFGQDPALEFLATSAEKRAWRNATTQEERSRFTEEFWKARDQSPDTSENEFRDTFARRVAFADANFGAPGERGSLTGRGRVFTLLGVPSLVRRRPLNSGDQVQAISRGSLGIEVGTVEYWFYTRDQLPVRMPQPTVTFRFVTHQGIGTFVLQRDGTAINTLSMTVSAATRKP